MNFVNENHEKHYKLWMERAKYVTDFVLTGCDIEGLREHLGVIEYQKNNNTLLIYCLHLKIHAGQDAKAKKMVCYACEEDKIKRYNLLRLHYKCKFCPIKWTGFNFNKNEIKCRNLNSPYYKLLYTQDLIEFADLCKQIANMKWREAK